MMPGVLVALKEPDVQTGAPERARGFPGGRRIGARSGAASGFLRRPQNGGVAINVEAGGGRG